MEGLPHELLPFVTTAVSEIWGGEPWLLKGDERKQMHAFMEVYTKLWGFGEGTRADV